MIHFNSAPSLMTSIFIVSMPVSYRLDGKTQTSSALSIRTLRLLAKGRTEHNYNKSMKIFRFTKVQWDATCAVFKYVHPIRAMVLKSTRFKSISEATAFVEKEYGVTIVSCKVTVEVGI